MTARDLFFGKILNQIPRNLKWVLKDSGKFCRVKNLPLEVSIVTRLCHGYLTTCQPCNWTLIETVSRSELGVYTTSLSILSLTFSAHFCVFMVFRFSYYLFDSLHRKSLFGLCDHQNNKTFFCDLILFEFFSIIENFSLKSNY